MPTTRKIKRDDFIKAVRPDPRSTEPVVLLQGYIADSDLDGHIRVYSDAALSDFIDLPEHDVLHAEPVKTEEDPLGGSRLWVKQTTVFTTGNPKLANRVKSTFLEGDLMQAYGNLGVGGAAQMDTGFSPVTRAINCQIVLPPSRLVICQRTRWQPTCLRTCQPVSCFATCFRPSCLQTCQISCFRTCNPIVCNYLPPTQLTEVYSAACPRPTPGCPITVETVVNPVLTNDPAYAQAAYTGGFNPYQTGYFGY